jgi:hypothetical protein
VVGWVLEPVLFVLRAMLGPIVLDAQDSTLGFVRYALALLDITVLGVEGPALEPVLHV